MVNFTRGNPLIEGAKMTWEKRREKAKRKTLLVHIFFLFFRERRRERERRERRGDERMREGRGVMGRGERKRRGAQKVEINFTRGTVVLLTIPPSRERCPLEPELHRTKSDRPTLWQLSPDGILSAPRCLQIGDVV